MTEPTQPETDSDSQFELEELSELLQMPASPEPLGPGTLLESPDGTLHIDAFLGRKAAVNLYEATFQEDWEAWLRETEDEVGAERLRHEFAVLAALKSPMFPQAFSFFEKDGRTYVATEPVAGPTMADALASKQMGPVQVLSALTQVAFAVSQLHAQGWSHLALTADIGGNGEAGPADGFGPFDPTRAEAAGPFLLRGLLCARVAHRQTN